MQGKNNKIKKGFSSSSVIFFGKTAREVNCKNRIEVFPEG